MTFRIFKEKQIKYSVYAVIKKKILTKKYRL